MVRVLENLLSSGKLLTFYPCLHMVGGDRELVRVSFIRAMIPFMKALSP